MSRVTRREIRAWLEPMRRCFAEMRTGDVDSIRGYAVTRLHHADDYARIDYCIAGFRGLIARLIPCMDCGPLEVVEKRLASGVHLTIAEIDAAFGVLKLAEDSLISFDRDAIKSAVLTEQVAIEVDSLGIRDELKREHQALDELSEISETLGGYTPNEEYSRTPT